MNINILDVDGTIKRTLQVNRYTKSNNLFTFILENNDRVYYNLKQGESIDVEMQSNSND